jgi:plasmid stabilization system protein ParE
MTLDAGMKPDALTSAVSFSTRLVPTVSRIETNPEIGTALSADSRTRRALVAGFPYQVVYRLRPAEIVIVAIAHLKRRPGYWKNRS